MCPCKSRSWPAFKYLWTTPHLFYSCIFLFQRLQQSPIFSHHCCKVLFPIFGNAGISLHFASCFSRQTVRVYLFTLWINVLNGVFFKVKYARKCELEYQSFFFFKCLDIIFFTFNDIPHQPSLHWFDHQHHAFFVICLYLFCFRFLSIM